MSFLLRDFKELNYNELVEVNGGCAGIIKRIINSFSSGNRNTSNTGYSSSGPTNGCYGPVSGTSSGCSSITITSNSSSGNSNSTSSSCSGSINRVVSGNYYKQTGKTNNEIFVTPINTSTASCSGAAVSYHSQLMFNDSNMNGGTKFGKTACGTTSLINEISEQYSKETGKTLSDAQVLYAVQKAINAGKIRASDAFVKDWGGAAQVISEAIGLKGKWTYTTNAREATAVIISIDTDGDNNFDGYHDHFVNDIGNGQYYDPYKNEIGYINNLHLTKSWAADDGIKSAYRYINYSTK